MDSGHLFDTITLGHIVVALVVLLVGIVLYMLAVRDLNRFRRNRGDPEEPEPTVRSSLADVLRDLRALSSGNS